MGTVNLKAMLRHAQKHGYAVGAFNILDYNSMRAVIESAEEMMAPVIVQTSVKTVKFWGYGTLSKWFRHLTENTFIPAALFLDHCTEMEVIERCIAEGWTAVMIDASKESFEENLRLTRKVINMAAPYGISVEAELGSIRGVEEDIEISEAEELLADPEMSEKFCRNLPLTVFAPAVGTAHGIYRGEPKIAYDRIEEISKRTGLPLALHGGSGLADEVFQKCISLGCAKVNISTNLKYSFIDGFLRFGGENPGDYNPLHHLEAQSREMKRMIKGKISLFGGEGKAVEIMETGDLL